MVYSGIIVSVYVNNHQLGQLCEDLAKAAVQQMFLAKNKELQSWRDEARRPKGGGLGGQKLGLAAMKYSQIAL